MPLGGTQLDVLDVQAVDRIVRSCHDDKLAWWCGIRTIGLIACSLKS